MSINITETPTGIIISGLTPEKAKQIRDTFDKARDDFRVTFKNLEGSGDHYPNIRFQIDDDFKITITGSVDTKEKFTQLEETMKTMRDELKENIKGFEAEASNPTLDGRRKRHRQSFRQKTSPRKKSKSHKKKRSRKH
jgi:hypothetical protein